MGSITTKQRRNAERELTSMVCAGCDGTKDRGFPFCDKCTNLLVAQGKKNPRSHFMMLTANTQHTAEAYTERLAWLLSSKGQRLRLKRSDVYEAS